MFTNLNTGVIGVRAALPETIDYAKRYGFAGVDFSIEEAAQLAAKHSVQYVRDLFAEAGIRPGSWGFPVEYRKDEATWKEGIDKLPALAKLASELGCPRTATWVLPGYDDRDYGEQFKFLLGRLRPAAEILDDYGCRIGLEFIGPKTLRSPRKYMFIHTMDGMLAFAAAVGTGNVGLLLDIFHLYTSHGQTADVLELSNADVVTVHINDAPKHLGPDEQLDNVRALPGETGLLDITGFLQALKRIGYDGPVTAEPFSRRLTEMTPEEAVRETSEAVHSVWRAAGLDAAR